MFDFILNILIYMFEFWRDSIQCRGDIHFLEEKPDLELGLASWSPCLHDPHTYPVVKQGVHPVPFPYLPLQEEKGDPQQGLVSIVF